MNLLCVFLFCFSQCVRSVTAEKLKRWVLTCQTWVRCVGAVPRRGAVPGGHGVRVVRQLASIAVLTRERRRVVRQLRHVVVVRVGRHATHTAHTTHGGRRRLVLTRTSVGAHQRRDSRFDRSLLVGLFDWAQDICDGKRSGMLGT